MAGDCALHDYMLVKFSQSLVCQEEGCGKRSRAIKVHNTPVFDDHGCVEGIEAVVRYLTCDHIVDGAEASPEAVAHFLNEAFA